MPFHGCLALPAVVCLHCSRMCYDCLDPRPWCIPYPMRLRWKWPFKSCVDWTPYTRFGLESLLPRCAGSGVMAASPCRCCAQMGIVHGNVRASSILVVSTSPLRLAVADFSSATVFDTGSVDGVGQVVSTPPTLRPHTPPLPLYIHGESPSDRHHNHALYLAHKMTTSPGEDGEVLLYYSSPDFTTPDAR